ncbi:MAG: type II toxin-antitoxin system VapC family toxin [Deltaproteobacteria bacterium]|nr:type II toxin-antitoxin system VapC family toxin [Deltaproteobacteria bacterium]
MKFWDASAIIPLCIEEPHTGLIREIINEDKLMVVWWGTIVECRSAVARLRRDHLMTAGEENQVIDLFTTLSSIWTEIRPGEDMRNIAGRLLLNHPLRAADSLQLAAALIWAGKLPRGHIFVCLDHRLQEAARREGFDVLPKSF